MDKAKTGLLIREARKNKNLTQSELGDMLGVTNKAISRWENGDSFPDIGVLEELSNVLDLKIQDLVVGEIIEDDQEHDKRALAEIVHIAKMQVREKRRKIFEQLVLFASIACALISGIVGMKGICMSAPDIAYYVLLGFSLSVVVLYIISNEKSVPNESIFKYSLTVAVVTLMWCVIMTCSVAALVIKGIMPFGLAPASVGPFIMIQLNIIFVINSLLLLYDTFQWSKETGVIHVGLIVSLSVLYLCALYGDYLNRLTSPEGFIYKLMAKTGIVLLELFVAMIIVRIYNKKIK